MLIETELTKLLNISHPIILAPMALIAGGELASAVSHAGGLGLVGGGYGDQDWLREQCQQARDSSYGIGFITWSLKQDSALLEQALSCNVKAVMLSFGDISPFVSTIKDRGVTLIVQVQTVADAKRAVEQGADVIVAQGTEAGGHGAVRATLPLVPAIVDAVGSVPVVAAGGIADGRGLAAALMLGASGVLMGTRFYATKESLAPQEAKVKAVESSGDMTIRSSVFDILRELSWPGPYNLRTLRNEMTDRWSDEEDMLRKQAQDIIPPFQEACQNHDYTKAPVIVGEAIDLVQNIPSAVDVVGAIVEEAIEAIQTPTNFIVQAK